MKRIVLAAAYVVFGTMIVSAWADHHEGDHGAAKYSIKDVMKQGHKDGLLKKVLTEKASDADKVKLLDLYLSLIENEPPQGDVAGWQEKSGAAIVAAAKVAVGRDGALAELKTATNCKACHEPHKPPSD